MFWGYRQTMRGGLRGRHIVVLVVTLGIVLEIPLVVYIFSRDNGATAAPVTTQQNNLGGVASTLPLHPVAGKFKPDDTKLSDCSQQTCFEQAYGNISYYQGPKAAFALIEKQYAGGADPSCHRVVHMVGAAALARNHDNVAKTFAEGSSICWSGYYHGVLERAFLDVKSYDAKSLGAKSRSLCSDKQVRASSWLTYQCLHGLGHGLMITTGLQLPLSLDVCRELNGLWEQTSCKGGVFMENFVTSYGGQSPYVRNDDPLYPCDWVAEIDKYTCYQQATTRIVRVVGLDWEKIARICASAEKGWISTCFGSFGQNASVQSSRNPDEIVQTCAIARSYGGELECVRYAAMDIAGTYLGGKEATVLCEKAAQDLRAGCYEAIGRMLRHLRNTLAKRRAACGAITSTQQYVAACVAGSTKRSSIPGLTR
jgi:hypothetical protein